MTKFDMRSNPPYQVDWQNAASGKRVSATKRRVRWRFGFSDPKSLAEGKSGIECRGEEHEVVLVWSLTSGKRLVVADGQEVHFSFGKRTDPKFETTWTMASGGHMIKLIAHAAPPLFVTPGFKQFDLLLDGCSFFDMPKIYELGTKRNKANNNKLALVATVPPQSNEAYNNYAFSMPPDSSTRSSHHHPVSPASKTSDDSDDGSGRSARSAPTQVEPEPVVDLLSGAATTPGQDLLMESSSSPPPVTSPVQQQQQQQIPPPVQQQHDEFAPVETPQPPPFQMVSNQIMGHYASAPATTTPSTASPAPLALANESHTHYVHPQTPDQQQPYYQQQQQQQQAYYPQPPVAQQAPPYTHEVYQQPTPQQQPYVQAQPQPQVVTPESAAGTTETTTDRDQPPTSPTTNVVPSMAPLSLEELEAREKPPVSEMERAFQALVNLEDIEEEAVTPEQMKQQQKKMQNKPIRSQPLPPKAPEWHLGRNAKIGDIKDHSPPKAPPAKEIMRTHAFDPAAVHAGMMVVYGAATAMPPQQGATGFGYAAAQHQQMYHQQQQVYAAY